MRKQLSAIKYAEEPDAVKHKRYREWFAGAAGAPLGFFDTMLAANLFLILFFVRHTESCTWATPQHFVRLINSL